MVVAVVVVVVVVMADDILVDVVEVKKSPISQAFLFKSERLVPSAKFT
jgi:hypothetical protein